ncbi:MAG: thymidylate kinase [Candidatus Moraniibacteriota bacterium]|nr:MAG: thymidylate kinase [Candidatus Moranbacteria bacterium]
MIYCDNIFMAHKGKLIVIDGSDGSGKATQTQCVVRALKKAGRRVRTCDFPQYEKNFFGAFIGECITGEHGDFVALDPHITSVIYAADRFESSKKIQRWLEKGYTVVLDRYVSANQIHQGGKIADPRARKKFLQWLDTMEFGVFRLPRPDMVIYLDVSVQLSQILLQNTDKKKSYIPKGKKDLVEADRTYLENARKSALWLARNNDNWERIQCVKNGRLRSIEDIQRDILHILKKRRIF